jgi:prepilin-type N-terminal cleavage/methylation domain-containing protein
VKTKTLLKPLIKILRRDRQSGFTLIEMVTVLFIITMMSGLVFANYRSGNQQFALENEAYRLAQDLRKVQEMAMSSKEVAGLDPAGYGIYLSTSGLGYKIYADVSSPENNQYDAADYTVQDVSFASYIYIVNSIPNDLSVNYSPPEPITTLTGTAGEVDQATIVLGMTGSSLTRTVKVNRGGLIYVQ